MATAPVLLLKIVHILSQTVLSVKVGLPDLLNPSATSPCRHVFQLDTETRVLTPEHWQFYVSMFSESGFEVYEVMKL